MLSRDWSEFLPEGQRFQARLDQIKRRRSPADYGWYPHQTLTVLPVLADLIKDDFSELAELLSSGPIADVGCGDGELALLFASLGVPADAIDHAETNFNQLRGANILARELNLADPRIFRVCDVDLDAQFHLPREQYSVVLFLGTLYHLKNPFYVLEAIAQRAAYCVLSTRVAQMTRKNGVLIQHEPVAYLLGAREASNDPTNFWIFSEAGLMRLLERTGWIVRATRIAGCVTGSNPVDPDADQRILLLLRSRHRYPELHVRPLDGWHAIEQDAWRWTAKRSSLEVILPVSARSREFALKFIVPEAVAAMSQPLKLTCSSAGEYAGSITCESAGTVEFRGLFPEAALAKPAITLDFEVVHSLAQTDDPRDLGVLVPLLDPLHESTQRLPFRIS